MDLLRSYRVLKARRYIFFMSLLVTIMAALGTSLLLPKTYKAEISVVLNYKGLDPVSGLMLPAQLMPSYMATQIDIIKSLGVALNVVDELRLTEDPDVQEEFGRSANAGGNIRTWKAQQLLKNLDVTPSNESSVVKISYKGSDRTAVADTVNAFAASYQKVNNEIKADPLKRAAVYMSEQIKSLREHFEEAQRRVSAYQQLNGITSTDSRLDVEVSRLNEISTQLVQVEAQKIDVMSRGSHSKGAEIADSPDVMANTLVQNTKSQLALAEAKFNALSTTHMPNHPQYIAQLAEVSNLRDSLNRQIRAISRSVNNNAQILQKREQNLRAELEAQKGKILQINTKRDELKILTNEMESAQRAYESTMQRFAQIKLEGQSDQRDAVILTKAEAPLVPSSPRILLNLGLASVIGSMLGIAFTMLAENRDRRVRSDLDVVTALQAPLLGVITWEKEKEHGALSRTRPLLTG